MQDTKTPIPILYTFRRCPYAIRARLAIAVSGVAAQMCEVDLRHKPQAMLDCSPKGTVPVLHLPDGTVIDESIDIMSWALSINDPASWLDGRTACAAEALSLIQENDGEFKHALDHYKYAGRFPEHPADVYRAQGEAFLLKLNARLITHAYLLGSQVRVADMAIFPFVRQFAEVDRAWFNQSPYDPLKRWLRTLLASPLFVAVMRK